MTARIALATRISTKLQARGTGVKRSSRVTDFADREVCTNATALAKVN